MGLFENPYLGVPASEAPSKIHTPETIALARELDGESIVLLENHKQTLPLSKSAKIAVIGPMAHGYMNVSFSSAPDVLSLIFDSTVIMSSMRVSTEESLLLMASRQQVKEL